MSLFLPKLGKFACHTLVGRYQIQEKPKQLQIMVSRYSRPLLFISFCSLECLLESQQGKEKGGDLEKTLVQLLEYGTSGTCSISSYFSEPQFLTYDLVIKILILPDSLSSLIRSLKRLKLVDRGAKSWPYCSHGQYGSILICSL